MAAVVELVLNTGDKVLLGPRAIGDGAIGAGDELVTNTKKWPKGTTYYDNTGRILYIRAAEAGVIGDWHKTAQLTVHS